MPRMGLSPLHTADRGRGCNFATWRRSAGVPPVRKTPTWKIRRDFMARGNQLRSTTCSRDTHSMGMDEVRSIAPSASQPSPSGLENPGTSKPHSSRSTGTEDSHDTQLRLLHEVAIR